VKLVIKLHFFFLNNIPFVFRLRLTGVDRPSADVLRRTDLRTGLVHGAKRHQRTQIDGVQRQDHHLHHSPAVFRGVLHVRQDTIAGQRPNGFPGHSQRCHRVFQNVITTYLF